MADIYTVCTGGLLICHTGSVRDTFYKVILK